MYNADRHSKEFVDGLHYFLDVAEANKNGFMCCPCIHCQNKKDYTSSRTSHGERVVSCPITFIGLVMEKEGL
jgi:hypothetical protein